MMLEPVMRPRARPQSQSRVVIVGGGYAGVSCALRLARLLRNRAEITLISPTERFIERIRLHQRMTGQNVGEWDLRALLRGTAVRLRIGELQGLDYASRTVLLQGERVGWDELVLAIGSRTDRDAAQGVREHALTLELESVRHAGQILARVAASGGRVIVVGGGLTGIEAAAEIAERLAGLQVQLVSDAPLAEGWSSAGRVHLDRTLARLGVLVQQNVRIHSVSERRLETSRGEIQFDACLWAGGFVAHPLARQAGLAVNERGQVLVDAALRSISHPAVHVAGDLAAVVPGEGVRMPMGCKSAMPTGVWVAENIRRRLEGRPELPLQYWAPFFCVSLGRRDGLIQMAGADGELTGRVLTGRRGACFKELICRSTMWALRLERLGVPAIVWFRRNQPRTRTPQLLVD